MMNPSSSSRRYLAAIVCLTAMASLSPALYARHSVKAFKHAAPAHQYAAPAAGHPTPAQEQSAPAASQGTLSFGEDLESNPAYASLVNRLNAIHVLEAELSAPLLEKLHASPEYLAAQRRFDEAKASLAQAREAKVDTTATSAAFKEAFDQREKLEADALAAEPRIAEIRALAQTVCTEIRALRQLYALVTASRRQQSRDLAERQVASATQTQSSSSSDAQHHDHVNGPGYNMAASNNMWNQLNAQHAPPPPAPPPPTPFQMR